MPNFKIQTSAHMMNYGLKFNLLSIEIYLFFDICILEFPVV